MKVLVTGGAGYVGSHACKAMAAVGHDPVVYDNLSIGHRGAVCWGPLATGDLLDTAHLDAAFEEHMPQAVMHFAALSSVGASMIEPATYYANNVSGSLCLLEAMRRHAVDTIIFSSTAAVYGVPDRLPLTETSALRPINPYGRTKLMVETILADYAEAYGLKWAAMRYFNAAGCDPDGEIGECHEPETHAIPLAIAAALGTGPEFKIFGDDYDTPDGTAIRDYVHVSDLAEAHVGALSYLVSGEESGAFNLATGKGVSVREIVDAVARATGTTVPSRTMPRRAGDPPALYASPAKAERDLGFAPRLPDIDTMVATAVAFFKQRARSVRFDANTAG